MLVMIPVLKWEQTYIYENPASFYWSYLDIYNIYYGAITYFLQMRIGREREKEDNMPLFSLEIFVLILTRYIIWIHAGNYF